MANSDSRHNFKLPRWASTDAEVLSSNAAEPPTGLKDTGWIPGVTVAIAEYFNWLAQQASLFLSYMESVFRRRWTVNHLPRLGKGSSNGEVTAGVGLTVDVALGRAWIQGAQYEVAAVTNLALDAADATHPRYDMVVIDVTAGIPSFAVVTGTPAASPAEPSVGSSQVALARVRVNASAVTPTQITDRRIFGALELDELDADRTLRAGDLGGGDWLLEVDDDAVVGGLVKIAPVAGQVDIGNTLVNILPGASQVSIGATQFVFDGEAVEFTAPVLLRQDIGLNEFMVADPATQEIFRAGVATPGRYISGDPAGTPISHAWADLHVPNGCVIKAIRLYGNRSATDRGLRIRLYSFVKTTGAGAQVGTTTNDGSGSSGNFVLSLAGLSEAVDNTKLYELTIEWEGAGACQLFGAVVEYEMEQPFAPV